MLCTSFCDMTPVHRSTQDLLIYQLKGLGALSHHARMHGITDPEVRA